MTLEDVPEFVKEALILESAIGLDDDLESTGLYDSTGKLMLIAAIDRQFNKLVSIVDLNSCKTPRALFELATRDGD